MRLRVPPRREGESQSDYARRHHTQFRLIDAYRKADRASKGASVQKVAQAHHDVINHVVSDLEEFRKVAGRLVYQIDKMRDKQLADALLIRCRAEGLVVEDES